MSGFPWLPIGTPLSGDTQSGRLLDSGPGWQLCAAGRGTALLLRRDAGPAWWEAELSALAEAATLVEVDGLVCLLSPHGKRPYTVAGRALDTPAMDAEEAQALVRGLSAMADRQGSAGWGSALMLPGAGFTLGTADAPDEDRKAALVAALSGGVGDPALTAAAIVRMNRRLAASFVQAALDGIAARPAAAPDGFTLPGQPALEALLRDQVLDVLHRPAQYARLGVPRPGGVLLAGPPGCGKSYAASSLAAFLGWTLHEVSVSSVGSMWLHETPRLLAKAFAAAAAAAPAIVLLEELDALGKTRAGGSAPAAEEVNTLLREVEHAPARGLLVIGTTNRLDAIDPALRRRGRFDIVFTMDYADGPAMEAVLAGLLQDRPHAPGLDLSGLGRRLARRPVSDLVWVVNEAARAAVRAGRAVIDDLLLARAANQLPARGDPTPPA